MAITENWRVEVFADGEQILAIEPGMLAGADITDDYADTIRHCARHLLSFVGPERQSDFLNEQSEQDNSKTDQALSGQVEPLVIRWKPIETSPKDGTIIDIWCSGERLCNYRWVQLSRVNGFFECVDSGYTCVRDAEYWMEIPDPPYNTKHNPAEQSEDRC